MDTNIASKDYHKKTVIQVLPSLVTGGVERGTVEIAQKLAQSGYNSIVISSGGPLVENLSGFGAKHIRLNVATKNPFLIWRNARLIAKIIKDNNADIIHARSRAPAWSCFFASKATRIKFVTTFHGVYNFSNFLKKFYNSIMTKGEKVIAVSNFVKSHLLENYDIRAEKIHVIYRGVDYNYFSSASVDRNQIAEYKEKYLVPAATPVLLLPSRMTRWKGQLVLIEALNRIRDHNFYCLLVGDLSKHPMYVAKVREMIEKLGMRDKIRIFAAEPNIRALYAISDIVLSTSIEPEAFGRTIIEAQSMEKIVIATDIGGAAETIKDFETGFHVRPNDPDDLAETISRVLNVINPGTEKANLIQSKARQEVIDKFSLDFMRDRTLELYKAILKKY